MAVKIDLSGLRRQIERVTNTPKDAAKAVERARSTLRRRIVPEARRDIQAEYNLKASRILQGLRANNTADGVELIGAKRGIGLVEFGGKWKRGSKTGASYQVRKDKGRSSDKLKFIATLLGGNPHIVERTGKKRVMTQGRYKGKRREAIDIEYGPSIAQMLRREGRAERLGNFAARILSQELARLSR